MNRHEFKHNNSLCVRERERTLTIANKPTILYSDTVCSALGCHCVYIFYIETPHWLSRTSRTCLQFCAVYYCHFVLCTRHVDFSLLLLLCAFPTCVGECDTPENADGCEQNLCTPYIVYNLMPMSLLVSISHQDWLWLLSNYSGNFCFIIWSIFSFCPSAHSTMRD